MIFSNSPSRHHQPCTPVAQLHLRYTVLAEYNKGNYREQSISNLHYRNVPSAMGLTRV